MSGYASRYISVVGNAQLTASMLYRQCYALLQLSRSQATYLVPALEILAGVSHTLSILPSCPQRPTSSQLEQYLGGFLDRTLDLLNAMTSCLQDLSLGIATAAGPSGLQRSLMKPLEAFDLQADQLLNEIWTNHPLWDMQEPFVRLEEVRLLLQSQDKLVRTTKNILLAEKASRHEFTCEWFSKPFLDFVRGTNSALWIDGRIGCGKSVLCGWILEILQSPVDGRDYALISHAIDPVLPSKTSTACVIKALL